MKTLYVLLLLFIAPMPPAAWGQEGMVGRPMPMLPNKTLDGMVINEHYYKGHVTIVSFMYIGCAPCMKEISTLNKIKAGYRGLEQLQVLCVARQTATQMEDFNSRSKTLFGAIRAAMGADSIQYAMQPACSDTESKAAMRNKVVAPQGVINLGNECNTIEEHYGVSAYPTIFYVDKKGIIRKIARGGPATKNDTAFYERIRQQADLLLAE